MKVLFTLHDEFDPHAGGMGVTAGLGEAYRGLGHEVSSFSFGDLPQRLPFRVKALFFPELMAWRLRAASSDVIDASCGDAWLWATLRKRRNAGTGPLLVTRSHGLVHIADIARREEARRGALDLSWKYPLYWGGFRLWEVARSFRLADLCLFLNDEERDFAVDRFGLDAGVAHVVDNGIPDYMLGRGTGEASTPGGGFGIAHVGSYLPLKGTAYLVEALSAVLERHPEAHVSFFGTSCPPEQVLRDFEPELKPRIEVVPKYRREDLPDLLNGQAIVVSATLKEGFGLGIMESMAGGLAPVSADAAGPLRYIRDGENGLIVPRSDSAALAAAVERLIAEPELLQRLRTAAYETAQHYSWNRVAGETLALYAEALERRRIGAPT